MALLREQRRAAGRRLVRGARRLRNAVAGHPDLPGETNLPRRILIVRPYFLGDIILCLPVAQTLKRLRPEAHVAWLLREEWRDLVGGHSVVDEVIPFSEPLLRSVRAPGEFLRVARELRRRSFDLVLNLAWDRSSILWTGLAGARVTLGIEEYGRPRLLSLLHTRTVMAPERSGDRRHMADFYFAPLQGLGLAPRAETPRLRATPEESEAVEARLAPLGERDGFLLVHPGGRLVSKRWAPERFAELIRGLGARTKCGIVLVCGPGEEGWAADLAAALPPGRGLFWPAPRLGELMALASRARLFLGNDSGPMHLAAASGARALALFGNDPTRWAPLGEGHRIVDVRREGLRNLPVEPVLEAALIALE